jgi:hypothetical protein
LEPEPEPVEPGVGEGPAPGVVVTNPGVPEGETAEEVESCPAAEHVLEYADKAAWLSPSVQVLLMMLTTSLESAPQMAPRSAGSGWVPIADSRHHGVL